MSKKTTITYISPTNMDVEYGQLTKELPIEFVQLDSIEEIFPLLSSPKFKTDLIIVDVEKFYHNSGVNIFDIIHTLNTLIKCTVVRIGSGKPIKRDTKIVAMANENTDPGLIKEILSYNDIKTVVPRYGAGVSYNEIKNSMIRITANDFGLDKKVQDWMKPKRVAKKENTASIRLTPRQSQILTLVSERGASNKIIARMLNISESTVKLHISAILKKFGVRNRTQLAIFSRSQ
jgi:DNA-binding CsgD family transcriptional regulator